MDANVVLILRFIQRFELVSDGLRALHCREVYFKRIPNFHVNPFQKFFRNVLKLEFGLCVNRERGFSVLNAGDWISRYYCNFIGSRILACASTDNDIAFFYPS